MSGPIKFVTYFSAIALELAHLVYAQSPVDFDGYC